MRLALPTLALLLFFGCSSSSGELDATSSDAGLARDASGDVDALPTDRGLLLDALPDLDGSGSGDALGTDALAADAGAPVDAGNAEDAGMVVDAGEVADAGATDAGSMGCGALGRQCSMGVECGGNLACTSDRCFPLCPTGGFVMAVPQHGAGVPVLRRRGLWAVFTTAERNCLCSDPTLRLLFPCAHRA
jgi:hypothetical protein